MFLKWRSVDPDNYTYPVLGEALRRESMELFNEFVKEVHRAETDTSYVYIFAHAYITDICACVVTHKIRACA